MSIQAIKTAVKRNSNKTHAKLLQRFFKTGKGEYGEGDIFAGIKVPVLRQIAKANGDTSLSEIKELIKSPIHEERFISLVLLMDKYKHGTDEEREKIFRFYMENTKYINSWDLVDVSCPRIVGRHLYGRGEELLVEMAKSSGLWKRRIGMISTMYFIDKGSFDTSFRIAEILLRDEHDLIHKAVGWMLREIGKKDFGAELKFMKQHYHTMPRTMLRYAIEKFPEELRQQFLKGEI